VKPQARRRLSVEYVRPLWWDFAEAMVGGLALGIFLYALAIVVLSS